MTYISSQVQRKPSCHARRLPNDVTAPTLNELMSDRPLCALGYDVSTLHGAMAAAIRMRLYWLRRCIDVPVSVNISTTDQIGHRKPEPIYSAQADFRAARKVSVYEAEELTKNIEATIKEVLL